MTFNIITLFVFYKLILFSVLGYGLLFEKIINRNISYNQLGYTGLIGIFFLILYSYISNIFFPHGYVHNLIIVFTGLVSFFFYFFKDIRKFDFSIFFINFLILFLALLIFKTHDDFPYYHFPYTYHLTQHTMQIGIGQFNHGFRTPSSILYLNSLFYLPIIKYYSFYIPSLLIMGFSNLILISKILLNLKKKDINYSFYLSILFFAFINIFFYRIQEHGTDRSAMILIFILFLQLINLVEVKKYNNLQINYIFVTLGIIITLKAFYILYLIFAVPLLWIFYIQKKFNIIFEIFQNKFFYIFIFLFSFNLLIYFFNTGCFLYPVYQTCFDNFDWSLGTLEAIKMNNHYQLWSKAGLTPNFRIDNPEIYLKNFNWVSNWLNLYFYNKVSDFLFGLLFLSLISLIIFYDSKKRRFKYNKNIFLIFSVVVLLLLEWFINHPALRYGGYVLVAFIILFPISLIMSTYAISLKRLNKRIIIFFLIVITIFISRNFKRLDNEIKQYKYKPFSESFYYVDQGHFRIDKNINKLISNFENCEKNISKCDKKLKSKVKKVSKNRYIFIPE